jgi:hypothetical protein
LLDAWDPIVQDKAVDMGAEALFSKQRYGDFAGISNPHANHPTTTATTDLEPPVIDHYHRDVWQSSDSLEASFNFIDDAELRQQQFVHFAQQAAAEAGIPVPEASPNSQAAEQVATQLAMEVDAGLLSESSESEDAYESGSEDGKEQPGADFIILSADDEEEEEQGDEDASDS